MIDQHNSLAEKFLKKWFWLYLFSFIIAPIWYIIKIIISGELTVSEVWILYGIISLVTMISAYNDLGMSESINYFVPRFINEKRYDKVKTIIVYALIAQMVTGITIAAWFFFGSSWLAENYFQSPQAEWVLKIFAFYFLGINIIQILTMFFSSIQNTFAQKLIELIRMWFSLLLVLSVWYFNLWNINNFSYAWIIWLYIWILFSIFIFYKQYFNKFFKYEKIIWDTYLFKSIFKYGILVFLWVQAYLILSQIDMQMIIYLLWTEEAWYYTNYLSIIWIPFLIITPIFSFLFPLFSELYSKWETQKICLVKEIMVNNFTVIWLAFNIFLFIFAIPITYTLFGEKFLISWHILQYSILFLIFNFYIQINFNILAWVWRVKERVKIIISAIVINIILNMFFIKLLWVYGAALATAIWWIYIFLMSEYIMKWEFKIKIDWLLILKNLLIFSIIWICINYFYGNFEQYVNIFDRLTSLFILLWIGIIYFCIFAWINYSTFKIVILEIKKLKK